MRREHTCAVLNVDETGWRTNDDKRYLWAFVALRFVVYRVAATRGSEVLTRLLGAVFRGVLWSDRFSAYLKYHSGKAQFCWAHLKRNLLGIIDLTKNSAVERFCRDALAVLARLFRLWHKFRGGQIDRGQLLLRSTPIQQRTLALAEQHLDSSHREVRNLATALFEHNERLFTFLEQEGVEPTNNSAERALRTGVEEKSASGIAVPQANWPRLACSLWLKPVSYKSSTSWLISLPQLPAIGDVSGQPHYYRVDQPELLRFFKQSSHHPP